MKKLSALITAAALFIIIWACSDYENTNPFHPDSENIVPLQNLTLQPQKVDHIQVIWDSDYLNENEGYKFRVDRKVGDGEWVEKYKLFNSDVYTFIDSAAGIDQTNEYRVSVAFDDHLSTPLTRSVFNEFYSPTGLDLTNINLNTVQLRWSDNSNGEDGFKIDRYSLGEWAESFVTLGENTEAWTDSTVIPNDSVQYKISAFKSGVYSAEVLSDRVNTNIPAPTNFRHEFVNISTIKLSWTDNSTGEEGFRIEKRVAIGSWEVVHTASEDSTSWTDLFAEVGEVLQYRISSFKGSQASALVYSEGFNNPFPPPSNLRLSQLDLNTIRLDWTDNSLGEEGFKIDKRDSTGNWQYDIVSLGPNTESWIDTPTDIYDTLAYRIKAFKGTATSNTSEATISDITFPPPSGLTVTREGLTRLRFDWTDNSVGEDLFIIDKQIDSENWIISYGTVSADVVTWTDSLANVDHELWYRIYAKAGSNFSNYAVSEVIDNSIPAPSNLQCEKLSISSIRLTWTDNSIDEHGFIIDKFVNGAWDTDYAQVGRNSTQWTDISAEINRDIVYRIKAYYSTDYSDLCETGIINNIFPAPSNLTAQVTGMNITLNWTDNSIGETGFIIDKKYDGGLWQDNYTTVSSNIITWSETVADTGKYYYRVQAYSGTDQSAATAVAEAWIQQTPITFIKDYGTIDTETAFSGFQDIDGSYYIAVNSATTFIYKISEAGDFLWEKSYTGIGTQSVIQTTDSNIVFLCNDTGDSSKKYKLIKCKKDGSPTWSKVYGGDYTELPREVIQTSDGGFAMIGLTESFAQGGYLDAWLVKADSLGNYQWDETYEYADIGLNAYSLVETGDNGFIFVGYCDTQTTGNRAWIVKVDSNGNEIWNKTYDVENSMSLRKIVCCDDGNYVAVGWCKPSDRVNVFLIKIDNAGNKIWHKTFDYSVSDFSHSVSVTSDGGFIITGFSSITPNSTLLIKTDSEGNEQWYKIFNTGLFNEGYTVSQTADKGYMIVGYCEASKSNPNNALLIKTDANGNVEGIK